VLGQIRQRGAGEFYSGALAKSFVAAVRSIGGDLSIDALRAVTPQFLDPVRMPVGDHVLNVAPPPAAGGIYAAELIRMLTSARDYEAASEAEKPHLLVEAMKRAIADREGWMRPDGSSSVDPATLVSAEHAAALMQDYSPDRPTPVASLPTPPVARPENPWATGFVVVDRRGQAVACNLTMNMLFGTGRMAPGTGIFLAPAPGAGGASDVDLGPIMLVNEHTGGFHYAAVGSGGTTAPTAMAQVFLANVLAETGIADAIGARRLHHNGDPDIVFHEPGEPPARLDILKAMGYRTEQVEILGRVNAVSCSGGIARKPQTCQAASDTRANGLALLLLSD
jgi:gamma-glutamyltranspeptidase/glutathione hydrolase